MPQSFTCLYYHLVFSTRYREPVIVPEMRPRLWDYLGGIVRVEGGVPLAVGGMDDHVHMLVSLRQQPALSDVMREIKAGSSGWVHDTFPEASNFWWQTGYGAFTVSYSGIEKVAAYIANQEKHHEYRTYEDEFRALLTKHGQKFREEDLWD